MYIYNQQKAHLQYIKHSYKSLWKTENSVVHWAKDLKKQLKRHMQMENKQEKVVQLD